MKVRVTIMTENDNHINDRIKTTEELAELHDKVVSAWNAILKLMCTDDERAFVETCEFVEF